ncbi:hypothetical protein D3C84_406220 [compost metagenome]
MHLLSRYNAGWNCAIGLVRVTVMMYWRWRPLSVFGNNLPKGVLYPKLSPIFVWPCLRLAQHLMAP